MAVKDTILARLRKLLREQFEIDISTITSASTFGAWPMGFTDLVVNTELRPAIDDFFADLMTPVGVGKWDGDSTLGDVAGDILSASGITTIPSYRNRVRERIEAALAGLHVVNQGIPVAERPVVRDALNETLSTVLLRNVTLATLAGSRTDIVSAIMERTIV